MAKRDEGLREIRTWFAGRGYELLGPHQPGEDREHLSDADRMRIGWFASYVRQGSTEGVAPYGWGRTRLEAAKAAQALAEEAQMFKSNEFEERVTKLMKAISKMMEDQRRQKRDPHDWLQALYEGYTKRFLSDNNRIWTTGSILIPVSIAGFAAIITVDNPIWPHIAVLMAGSIMLMFIWLMIAENHRAFQQKSEAWIAAIERTIKLEGVGGPKVPGNILNRYSTALSVQAWRWIFFVLIVSGWCGVLALTLTGQFGD